MPAYPDSVLIEDESMRDGLQSEKTILSVEEILSFVRGLEASGVRRIQVGSFVHPKWVPQMANTDRVFRELERRPDVVYTALVLNEKGLERALACAVTHLSVSISASETHSLKNTHRTLAEGIAHARKMVSASVEAGIVTRAGIQSAFGCAYEGPISTEVVCDIARLYDELGAQEINLADSAGLADPRSIVDLVTRVRAVVSPRVRLSLHLHDTRGLGLANMVAGLSAGVTLFDACIGGIGGCPFIPGATGNIAAEDAVHGLERMGIATGIDWRALADLALRLEQRLGHPLPGRIAHLPRTSRSVVCAPAGGIASEAPGSDRGCGSVLPER
jgi:hydroxymethylglutaryl-CoA lyase